MKQTCLALVATLALVAAACTGDAIVSADPSTTETTARADTATTGAAAEPADQATPPAQSTPPDIDLNVHSVPLEEIFFDTFDGGSVPLSESTPELRARLLDAIPPIDEPVYGEASEGEWLNPDDRILGYVAGDQAYAYPFKILNFHEIVNDELDGVPVLISYCPLCGSGIVYDRRLPGQVLSFGNTSALYESDLVMVDRTTGSYWWQVAGTAIVGPKTGTVLEPLPSTVATWADWKSQHSDTLVLTRETGFSIPYERDAFSDYAGFLDSGQFAFPVGDAARDDRLRPSELISGVVVDGVARAYPVEGLVDPINDSIGSTSIVIFPVGGGAAVFSADLEGRPLEFQRVGDRFEDVETGSSWNAGGVAVSGELRGTALDPLPSRTTFWFAFIGAFPDAQIHE